MSRVRIEDLNHQNQDSTSSTVASPDLPDANHNDQGYKDKVSDMRVTINRVGLGLPLRVGDIDLKCLTSLRGIYPIEYRVLHVGKFGHHVVSDRIAKNTPKVVSCCVLLDTPRVVSCRVVSFFHSKKIF